jgi:hypothetical protein
MSTKKADLPKKAPPVERGRFAELLGPGYVMEISPSKRRPPKSAEAKRAEPKR